MAQEHDRGLAQMTPAPIMAMESRLSPRLQNSAKMRLSALKSAFLPRRLLNAPRPPGLRVGALAGSRRRADDSAAPPVQMPELETSYCIGAARALACLCDSHFLLSMLFTHLLPSVLQFSASLLNI